MQFFKQAYVDMDGVLCDLAKGVLAIHNKLELYPLQEYLTAQSLGMTRDELWAPVVQAGARFWENLEIYPWAYDLMNFVTKIAREVSILTKPLILEGANLHFKETGLCVEGKLRWIHNNLGDRYGVIFTDLKHKLSRRRCLLIDDDQNYEAAFVSAGGQQFIWPQPYNRFKGFVGREMHSLEHWYEILMATGLSDYPKTMADSK